MVMPSLTPAALVLKVWSLTRTHTHAPVLVVSMWSTLAASPVRYTPAVQCHKTEPKRTPVRTREPDPISLCTLQHCSVSLPPPHLHKQSTTSNKGVGGGLRIRI